MSTIERTAPPSTGGGGGEEYKAGEGLEETGSKPVTFKVKAEGIVTGLIGENQVTLEKLSIPVRAKLAEIKAYTAKVAGGLELSGTEFLVKAEGITNAMIVAAAGIPESKLLLPEVVLKTGVQSITGEKTFNESVTINPNLSLPTAFALLAVPEGRVEAAEVVATKALEGPLLLTGPLKYAVKSELGLAGIIQNNYKLGKGGLFRLGSAEATSISGVVAEPANEAGQIILLANVGKHTVTLLNSYTIGRAGALVSASVTVKELEKTSDLQVGNEVAAIAGVIEAGTTIAKILSASEIELSKKAKKTETSALTFEPSTAANRFLFSTGANAALLENQEMWLVYDGSTKRWRDMIPPGVVWLTGNQTVGGVKSFTEAPLLTKGIGVWGHAAPVAQHAAIANPTTLLEVAAAFAELNEVIKAYGLTA